MKIKIVFTITFLFSCTLFAVAQKENSKNTQLLDLTGSIGNAQGTFAFSYNYNWKLGKKKKFVAGAGVRFTSYFGSNKYFTTAPARITSGKTGPTVFFIESIKENIDSLLLPSAQTYLVNLDVNLGYHISKRIYAGFNIDAIGFSFGGNKNGRYVNGTTVVNTSAKPTSFNLLLVSDNDRGSLNSEFFAAYQINNQWSIKSGFQFLFTEYTTSTNVQQVPEPNDRFRNKVTAFSLGIRYQLK